MKPSPGAVGNINQSPIIKIHSIRLNYLFHPRLGFFRRVRNKKSNLYRVKRIGNIHDSQTTVEISYKNERASDDLVVLGLGKLMRTEPSSPFAEITIRNLEGSNRRRNSISSNAVPHSCSPLTFFPVSVSSLQKHGEVLPVLKGKNFCSGGIV